MTVLLHYDQHDRYKHAVYSRCLAESKTEKHRHTDLLIRFGLARDTVDGFARGDTHTYARAYTRQRGYARAERGKALYTEQRNDRQYHAYN